jgi:hypothetical protein
MHAEMKGEYNKYQILVGKTLRKRVLSAKNPKEMVIFKETFMQVSLT